MTFSEGGSTLGTETLSSTGTATFSTTALPVGSDIVTAAYSGNTTYVSTQQHRDGGGHFKRDHGHNHLGEPPR